MTQARRHQHDAPDGTTAGAARPTEIDGEFQVKLPDGAMLRALSQGQGRPLLLVSGLAGSAAFWDDNAATLARSFKVLRFDQRGIGASDRGSAPCTIDQLARDCLAVLDAAGIERATVLGHSTGGCIGLSLARQAPERLDGLIISGGWLKQNRYMTALFETRLAILDQHPRAYAATAALMTYPPTWLEAHWSVYETAVATAPETPEAKQIVRERIDALRSFDGSSWAGEIDVPTLILGTRDDMIVPAFLQEELAAAMPGARKTLLDSGGHFFPISRPDAFTANVAEWIGAL
ncbi:MULTISPECIES: alpha/beta fold hydrolase [unclassified Bosea (in: a-proteobacteria)]|uniref:alpha/beta fold hydrolase n=1 Tax=unclassified Bosea (in: a-proteobacteria) TaxID=2653178 RepID=UPI000F7DB6BB|nr:MULTISPECIES: alpha/beta fold hydrolase [unclassified Bosea (in: a-proteobacteria)]RXT16376.1 alpha/beta hydrolase [Bosea sp. Tri-39]RXT40070.1 alpha/beta hydrolase [Bosea sp. Tri-54]